MGLRRRHGFTLIEMALVLLVGTIVLSGVLSLLQTHTANRQTAILNEAFESVKTTAILGAINNKKISVQTSCSGPVWNQKCVDTGVAIYQVPGTGTIGAVNDPWGKPFIYTQNEPTVTASTPATKPIFTVKSYGPNTAEGGGDDIEQIVTATEFIARVSRMGF